MQDNTAIAAAEYEDRKKNPVAAWLLWLFTGGIGGHRYYLGYTGMGVAMTLTLGGLGFWALIDAFFINRAIRRVNSDVRNEVFTRYGLIQQPVQNLQPEFTATGAPAAVQN